ncbi:MAG: hypothetical protein E6Q97_20920 [Desulfurellales bacterium]|nr:MAG: hypothetical protein E6Q97_20920 [Desulfurellales bacterium]
MAKKSAAKRVAERVQAGVCLVCDAPAEVRGLCQRHYRLFMRKAALLPQKEQQRFLEDAIREGLILPAWGVCALKRDDPFAGIG